jgi:type II secretory pathway component PulK
VNHLIKNIKSKQGSALIAVMLVMGMLTILGGGILAAASANVKSTVNDKAFKDSYYRGETAVNLAADSLKKAVDHAYNDMVGDASYLVITAAEASAMLSDITTDAENALPAELRDGKVEFDFGTPTFDAVLGGYTAAERLSSPTVICR